MKLHAIMIYFDMYNLPRKPSIVARSSDVSSSQSSLCKCSFFSVSCPNPNAPWNAYIEIVLNWNRGMKIRGWILKHINHLAETGSVAFLLRQ